MQINLGEGPELPDPNTTSYTHYTLDPGALHKTRTYRTWPSLVNDTGLDWVYIGHDLLAADVYKYFSDPSAIVDDDDELPPFHEFPELPEPPL